METLILITSMVFAVALIFTPDHPGEARVLPPPGSIGFASLAPRGWDVIVTDLQTHESRFLTDHPALDYNASFSPDGDRIAFVSERDGNMELYVTGADGSGLRRLTNDFALDDHPAWSPDGRRLAFVSTRQPAETAGQAWNGIYVMESDGSQVERLSPADTADYSPVWSHKGNWIAFASGSGKAGETDLYVMRPDGSDRRLVTRDGGWPAFAENDQSVFFHSRRGGSWGIWRVNLDGSGMERVTPTDVEAYAPRVSGDGKWLATSVLRGGHRQIELMHLGTKKWLPVTRDATDHWNPSISSDGRLIVYHKARPDFAVPNVELWGAPPGTDLKMLRLAGSFPAFSSDGRQVVLVGGSLEQLDLMNVDGSGRRTLFKGESRRVFSSSWAPHGGQIAFAVGGVFQGAMDAVDLMALRNDGSGLRKLTREAGNNGFPAFSPDGRRLVFRSGREGFKNLYIMDSDESRLQSLTRGKWTDTMCDWSPTGEWIAFASDRDGDFDIWLIRPDGSGLHKLIGGGGRNNHPHFSPDGQWVVFTSQRAGYSAEEISLPFQFQPYGDLFAIRLDGDGLIRLTHNGFEEGTPAWGTVVDIEPSGEAMGKGGSDY